MSRRGVRSRAPALTERGRLVLVLAAVLLVAGAAVGAWAMVALGLAAATLLATSYLAFYPAALLVWRRHVELGWRIAPAGGGAARATAGGDDGASGGGSAAAPLVAGRPFRLEVSLRNRAPIRLGRARIAVVSSSAIEPPRPVLPDAAADPFDVPPSRERGAVDATWARVTSERGAPDEPLVLDVGGAEEVTLIASTRARTAGFWFLHGASLELGDRLGLCGVRAYFPSPLPLRILPRFERRPPAPTTRAPGPSDVRVGRHLHRLRGIGGELRELRDHLPGDPFKQIAWKATARTGRLMVRDLDQEARVTHYLVVDIGASMRDPGALDDDVPGARVKLDHAIELAAAYAAAALDAGDPVALVTFASRVHRHLPPADGAPTRLRLVEWLMEAMNPVDEELTELTDGELVATVARYLRHQEAVDARLARAPAVDDPRWSRVAIGPAGELYDLDALSRAVDRLLGAARQSSREASRTAPLGGPVSASDEELGRLRLFCRLRGIELPPRRRALRATAASLRRRPSPSSAPWSAPAFPTFPTSPTSESPSTPAPRTAGLAPGGPPGAGVGLAAAIETAAREVAGARLVILSDLESSVDGEAPLARAVALARRRGHELLCVAHATVARPVGKAPARDTRRSRAADILGWEEERRARAARRQIERLGVTVVAAAPHDRVADLLHRLERRPARARSGSPSSRREPGC